MIVEPAAIVVIPIAGLAAFRRRWTFLLLLVSIPFFTLEVVTFASHPFTFPEIAMMLFIAQQGIVWLRNGRIPLPNSTPLFFLWGFLGVATLSTLALAIRGSPVLVHPYEVPFQVQSFVPLKFSERNVSQLFLRAFFVASVSAIAVYLDAERLKVAVRGVAYGAMLTAVIGVLYQAAIVVGWTAPIELLGEFGFRRLDTTPGSIGPLPRMYSLPGEPGFTSNHLLYGFALVGTLSLIPGSDWAFQARERVALAFVLGMALLASGGTTGYGGLLIFLGALTTVFVLVPKMCSIGVRRNLALVVPIVAVVATAVAIALGQTFIEIVGFQIQKMTFQVQSGTIRLYYIRRSIDIIRHHPILGVGVGSHAVPSYMFTLLAETGVVGGTMLFLAHFSPYRQCVGLLNSSTPAVRRGAAAVAIAGGTLFLTNLVAKSISSLIMPWYWFGLAVPIAVVASMAGQNGKKANTTRQDNRRSRSTVP